MAAPRPQSRPRPRSRDDADDADTAADDDPGEATALLSYAVGRLDRIIRTRLGEVLAPLDLTVAQMTTLSVLARRPGLSNAQLARRSLILPQSMIQVISALESRGLVGRTPAGGRTLQTQLTATGRAAVDRAERVTRALEAEMLGDGADPAEAAQVMAVMRRWSETLAAPRGARA